MGRRVSRTCRGQQDLQEGQQDLQGSAGWAALLLGTGQGLHAVPAPQRDGTVLDAGRTGVIPPGLMEICRAGVGWCLLPILGAACPLLYLQRFLLLRLNPVDSFWGQSLSGLQ